MQVFDGVRFIQGSQEDRGGGIAEFSQHLETGAAGADGLTAASDDGDGLEATVAGGDGRCKGGPFRAEGETVGRVLDIAAGNNFSCSGEECGADGEF